MKRSTIDIWVGAFVAAGFAGLLFLAMKVGNLAPNTEKVFDVRCILTAAAQQFVTPISVGVLAGQAAFTELFGLSDAGAHLTMMGESKFGSTCRRTMRSRDQLSNCRRYSPLKPCVFVIP